MTAEAAQGPTARLKQEILDYACPRCGDAIGADLWGHVQDCVGGMTLYVALSSGEKERVLKRNRWIVERFRRYTCQGARPLDAVIALARECDVSVRMIRNILKNSHNF